ncbi:MAG: hypothetical protein K9H16_16395 [Bacteroidales bacterium]|nr:hypothetical protein [Bacteroidales bacterium]
MLIIEKSEVANWLLLSYKSEQKQVKDKLDLFERKYNQSFLIFEMNIRNAEKEDFEKWDDYIEWKAYQQSLSKLNQNIREIEKGRFKVA